MEGSRTISELKSAFVRNQVRILSANLAPQDGWRDYGRATEGDLSDKTVDEVVQKLNVAIKQHNRIVYSTQAIHHISRQIESLYWDSVKREALLSNGKSSGVEKGTDLTDSANIEKLPTAPRFEEVGIGGTSRCGPDLTNPSAVRYHGLRRRLLELSKRREHQRQRLAQYKHIESLIEPFRDVQNNVQPNLITRDGELLQELDKMRILVPRVTGRIGQNRPAPAEAAGGADSSFLGPNERLATLIDTT